ncbi:hypothetical protein ACF0H5_019824 [Mactra antiquata]
MKNVIIKQVYAVGMHHSGVRQLDVGPIYYCGKEEGNPKDPNAIAVYEDKNLRHRVCYLRREDAAKLKDIVIYSQEPCYLRAKFGPEKFSRFKGPQQNCNIGFKFDESDATALAAMLNGVFIHTIF